MKVAELKLVLLQHHLPVKGKKAELIERYDNRILMIRIIYFYRAEKQNILPLVQCTTDSRVAASPPANNAFNDNVVWKKNL